MLRICRVRLQLLTQLQDLIINGASSRIKIVSPDLIQKDITCENSLGILGEKLQELELVSSKDDRLPVATDCHLLEVNFAISKAINGRRSRLALSADGCLNAGGERSWAEGLRDVVISPQFEKQYLIRNVHDRTEHHKRGLSGEPLECLPSSPSGTPGENQLKDHCEWLPAAKQIQARL